MIIYLIYVSAIIRKGSMTKDEILAKLMHLAEQPMLGTRQVIAEILADELNECLIDSEAASLLLKKERRQIAHLNALLQKYGLS